MKKHIPLYISLTILLGLLTLIISTNKLLDDIAIPYIPNAQRIIVIENDTLKVTQKLIKIPTYESIDYNNKKHTIFAYFNIFPATLNWIIFHCVTLSLSIASLTFLVALMYKIKKTFSLKFNSKRTLKVIIPLVLVLVIFGVFLKFLPIDRNPLLMTGVDIMGYFGIVFKNPKTITHSIINSYYIIGVFPLLGIMMVNIGINHLLEIDQPIENKNKTSAYRILNDSLNIFAFFTGLLVTVAMIGTKLQREMIKEQIIGDIEKLYPQQFIYVYGISFSLLLALFFLPSLAFLKYVKNRKEIILNDSDSQQLSWWKIGKESFDDAKLILSISLPFITSIIQKFI